MVDNVVCIVLDTARKDRLPFYGYDRETMPNLTEFAETATVFDQAVAPAPWTLPVHASLFTGQYPSEHQATQGSPYLEKETPTLAELLSANGFATACYSANAWITPYTRLTKGFDDVENFFEALPNHLIPDAAATLWQYINDTRLRVLADKGVSIGNRVYERFSSDGHHSYTPAAINKACDFMESHHESGTPFFLFMNLLDPHLPYYPPDEHASEFLEKMSWRDRICQNSKEYNSGARDISPDEWEAIRNIYDAELHSVDAQLSRVFDWLADTGHLDDTLVIVCGDHGELHGEHNLYGHEFAIYDDLVNVPLVVHHPDHSAERRTDQVEILDLYHTILDSVDVAPSDVSPPTSVNPARSVFNTAYRTKAQGNLTHPDYAFIEYHTPVIELKQLREKAATAGQTIPETSRFTSSMVGVRQPDAKYITNEHIDDEFYQLDSDPGEKDNRVDTAAADEMKTVLDEFISAHNTFVSTTTGDSSLTNMDADAKDRLRDLGYLD